MSLSGQSDLGLTLPGPGGWRPRPPDEVEDDPARPQQHHQTLQLDTTQSLLPAVAQPQQLQREVSPEVDEVDAGSSRVQVLEAVLMPGRVQDT